MNRLTMASLCLLLAGAGAAAWWCIQPSPRRPVADQAIPPAPAETRSIPTGPAVQAAMDERERLARETAERTSAELVAATGAAADERRRLAQEQEQATAMLELIARLDSAADDAAVQRIQARVTAYLGGQPLERYRTAVEQAWAVQQSRLQAQRQHARQERDAQLLLEAIRTLPATADDELVAQTRRRVEPYLAEHGPDAPSALVNERWQQALAAVGKQRQAATEEKAHQAAVAAQQGLLHLIATLGEMPSASALESVRSQVEAFTSGPAPPALRQEVTAAWGSRLEALAQAREFGAPIGPWMARKGRDACGSWAELSVGRATQRMRWIRPGTFSMGCSGTEAQWALEYAKSAGSQRPQRTWYFDAPRHQVELTTGFWLADTCCTREWWVQVMGTDPAACTGDGRHPVEMVDWDDCQVFLGKLSALVHGVRFVLPTEAQWEYACRAGTATRFWNGDDPEGLALIANTRDAAFRTRHATDFWPNLKADDGWAETSPVKSFPPNPWGLYDMHGNVCQWCADCYGDYPRGAVADPTGPASGPSRVARGGSWSGNASVCRSAYRDRVEPGCRLDTLGFRFALATASQAGPSPGGAIGDDPLASERQRQVPQEEAERRDRAAEAALACERQRQEDEQARCAAEALRLARDLPTDGRRALLAPVLAKLVDIPGSPVPERLRAQVRDALVDRPAWASAAGSDAYGLWAEMTVAGEIQRFRLIRPGTFAMGCTDDEAQWAFAQATSAGSDAPWRAWFTDAPQHQVTLSTGFWLADTCCTQALWQQVMGGNPSAAAGDGRHPVEMVSWDDCQAFLDRLAALAPGARCALPTEAQWEYACRAGTTTRFWNGDDAEGLAAIANTRDASFRVRYPADHWPSLKADDGWAATSPVKSFPPNPWGLYDMHGNVCQWCADWYGEYPTQAVTDPATPVAGSLRILRGGSWSSSAAFCRSAYRGRAAPDCRCNGLGFRLAAAP